MLPAYEDPSIGWSSEQQLPVNVDPLDNKLEDDGGARPHRAHLRAGPWQADGFVLPVQRWQAGGHGRWSSERWPLRRGRLFLVPGDSPVGFRLPMKTLPYVPPSAYPYIQLAGPDRDALTRCRAITSSGRPRRRRSSRSSNPTRRVRTALTVEPRDGVLCVFMPPTRAARGLSRTARGRRGRSRESATRRCASKAIRRRPTAGSTSSR